MKKVVFYTLLFFSINILSQSNTQKEVVYVDENNKQIDSITFSKKCVSNVLKCLKFDGDSLFLVNKILFKYSFGKITTTEVKQLKKILIKNNNRSFNLKSNIVVIFRDSLYDYGARKRFSIRHQKNHTIFRHKTLNRKLFDSSRKKWIKSQKKCVKKLKNRFKTETFHIYNYDYGSIKDYPDLNWIKDNGTFKNMFFNIKNNSGNLLVLKPDGEYFISGGHFSNEMLEELLKNDWNKLKRDFENSYKSLDRYGIGFFESNMPIHKKHCF